MSRVLCLWSGPRNISTATMRSFGARADTVCWDEPFFGAYLAETGVEHPGREETLAVYETDADKVAKTCTEEVGAPHHFQKHMAHHMLDGFPMEWAADARHVMLVRHPARVVASYAKGRPEFEPEDLGFSALRHLHGELETLTGNAPTIVDTDVFLADPKAGLRRMCDGFGIDFDPAMLSWEAGPREEDGPWAPWWYDSVRASTGFAGALGALPEVSDRYEGMMAELMADYGWLAERIG